MTRLLLKRTFAILRNAEFGFFGVIVRTTRQTPRNMGAPCGSYTTFPFNALYLYFNAGVFERYFFGLRAPLTI
jgi:hypothetical protein